MNARQIDYLNIGLIALSLLAAFWLPFDVFLFSYAVLGPLHYLTEISWLDERKYFTHSRYTPWILGAITIAFCLIAFYNEGGNNAHFSGFRTSLNGWIPADLLKWLVAQSTNLMFMSLVIAVAFTSFTQVAYRAIVICAGLLVAAAFTNNLHYKILAGSMLPTVIHVCVFTGIFMWYGAMKSQSRPGYLGVVFFIFAQIVIFYLPITPSNYYLEGDSTTATTFIASGFGKIMASLCMLFGIHGVGQTNFELNSSLGVRMAIFFAFIYTYHYLNWFSKTSIIGWHKVSKRKLAAAIIIWVAALALYRYDYRVGLLSLLFLSLLHVVLEFPLNYISIRGVLLGWKK